MEPPVTPISYKRHRFPADVIRHAVWLYFRFTLSFRDVEELLAQRGIEVSYETVRCWTLKFGRQFAHNLRRSRPRPTGRWHLDEMTTERVREPPNVDCNQVGSWRRCAILRPVGRARTSALGRTEIRESAARDRSSDVDDPS